MPDLDHGKYTVDEMVNLMEIAISNAEPNRKKRKIFSLDDILLSGLDHTMQIEYALNDAIKTAGILKCTSSLYIQP